MSYNAYIGVEHCIKCIYVQQKAARFFFFEGRYKVKEAHFTLHTVR